MTDLGSDTWNTPASLLAVVREVMGGIDCDPATNPEAQEVVQAATFYTLETDGLAHEWHGRVWINPPYSNVPPFTSKLLAELDAGRVTEAMVLVHARAACARWFQSLAVRAWRCDLRARPAFWNAEYPEGSTSRSASTVFYVGPNVRRFARVFRLIGVVTPPAREKRNPGKCLACGGPLRSTRPDARACSSGCRVRLFRRRKRVGRPPGDERASSQAASSAPGGM